MLLASNRRSIPRDEADLAFNSEQRHLMQALAAQRRSSERLQSVESCHHCGSTALTESRLFCDPDCARDWEYENSLRRS